ncbi:hypothetical protein [Cyanobium sp. ATX-6F1]|uniref:hypothetical protein n=1 Tax=Cyanobium sp. ATX-6F1 TaxID=3137388 RepID=UPI0039BDE4F1
MSARFLRQVQLLEGPDQPLRSEDVLLRDGAIAAYGAEARQQAAREGLPTLEAQGWLLAPALVDPHSVLEDPINGRAETLATLVRSAAAAGYGTVALLPRARSWRDRPERLQLSAAAPFELLLWGSFSCGGRGEELAPMGTSWPPGRSVWPKTATCRPWPCWSGACAWRRVVIGRCCSRPGTLR